MSQAHENTISPTSATTFLVAALTSLLMTKGLRDDEKNISYQSPHFMPKHIRQYFIITPPAIRNQQSSKPRACREVSIAVIINAFSHYHLV